MKNFNLRNSKINNINTNSNANTNNNKINITINIRNNSFLDDISKNKGKIKDFFYPEPNKGKEGLIEIINHEFENHFKYSINELRGMNISMLMSNVFAKEHNDYMKKYIKIREKNLLMKKEIFLLLKIKIIL